MSRTTILGLALAASLALNVVQWRNAARSDPSSGAARRSEPSVDRAPTPPRLRPAVSAPITQPAPTAQQLGTCSESLAACGAQITALHELYAQYLPPHKQFARGSRNEEGEAAVSAILDAIFTGESPAYDLECRADVCRVEIVSRQSDDRADLMRHLQDTDLWGDLVRGRSFRAGKPSVDPVSGEALFSQTVHLRLTDVEAVDGMNVLSDLLDAFYNSGSRAQCFAEHPDEGTLSVRLDVGTEEAAGRIRVYAGGDLAAKPGGRCLIATLETLAGQTPLPPQVSGAVRFVTIEAPP